MKSAIFWPLLITFTAILAGFFAWIVPGSPFRPVILFLFMLVIPGLAYTRLFHFSDLLAEIILAIALSLVTSTILAELMVFTHLWSPNAGLAVLIMISLAGVGLQVRNQQQARLQKVE